MRIVIIGGSGHVGTYLVPRLVAAEHEVINISRAQSEPYKAHSAWRLVQQVTADRTAEDAAGVFGQRILELKPDVVIDLICFTLESAQQLVGCLRERVQHFLHCGTIWVLGHSVEVPATEETPRQPFGDYGIQKAAIQDYLLDQARRYGFPATVLQPGHIVGPGWIPINPAGNLDPNVFTRLARGEEVTLPNIGMETLHHVHVGSLGSKPRLKLLSSESGALYAPPGYLLFVREGALMAHAFDARARQLTGEPVAVAEGVGRTGGGAPTNYSPFSASATGVLAFGSAPRVSNQLLWIDRGGAVRGPRRARARPAEGRGWPRAPWPPSSPPPPRGGQWPPRGGRRARRQIPEAPPRPERARGYRKAGR